MRKLILLSLLVFTVSMIGGVVYASVSANDPATAQTSLSYNIGYHVELTNTNTSQTIVVADTNASLGAGPRIGAIEVYNDLGNASQLIVPPPKTVTVTNTTTVTRTVTGPNGEKTVVTEVRTVTIPEEHNRYDYKLLGAGILALFFLLLISRR